MTIEHKFPVGGNVEVRATFAFQPWLRAVVQKHEPYLGRAGYYVSYPDAKEQWECHGGWVPEACVRSCGDCLGSGALRRDGDPVDYPCPRGCPRREVCRHCVLVDGKHEPTCATLVVR